MIAHFLNKQSYKTSFLLTFILIWLITSFVDSVLKFCSIKILQK